MIIEVLGPGCARCEQLYENVIKAVTDINSADPLTTPIEVKKITDVHYFAKAGVFVTPGIVIEGQVISSGKVLSPEAICEKIRENR